MSRVRLNIERLVLNGFTPGDAKPLTEALQSQLHLILADQANCDQWAHANRTPVLTLGRMPLETSAGSARRFGKQLADAIGRRLRT